MITYEAKNKVPHTRNAHVCHYHMLIHRARLHGMLAKFHQITSVELAVQD